MRGCESFDFENTKNFDFGRGNCEKTGFLFSFSNKLDYLCEDDLSKHLDLAISPNPQSRIHSNGSKSKI